MSSGSVRASTAFPRTGARSRNMMIRQIVPCRAAGIGSGDATKDCECQAWVTGLLSFLDVVIYPRMKSWREAFAGWMLHGFLKIRRAGAAWF